MHVTLCKSCFKHPSPLSTCQRESSRRQQRGNGYNPENFVIFFKLDHSKQQVALGIRAPSCNFWGLYILPPTDGMALSSDFIHSSKDTFVRTQVCFFYSIVQELDIIELEKRYWYLKAGTKTGKFDFETFRPLVSSCVSDALAKGTVCQSI